MMDNHVQNHPNFTSPHKLGIMPSSIEVHCFTIQVLNSEINSCSNDFFNLKHHFLCVYLYPNCSIAYMWSVAQETKSIGADVNWGVRFRDLKDVGSLMTLIII